MAQGLSTARTATDSLNGGTTDTTVLTPTAGTRIVGVDLQYTSPEVAMTGISSDSTGDSVTVSWKVAGKSGQTYPVSLTVFEVTDV
jgi:hypothetical protein